jgi:hypothetical protein
MWKDSKEVRTLAEPQLILHGKDPLAIHMYGHVKGNN